MSRRLALTNTHIHVVQLHRKCYAVLYDADTNALSLLGEPIMQRDMNLVREMLLDLEDGRAMDSLIQKYGKQAVQYHAHIMHQAELIHATDCTTRRDPLPQAIPLWLTWKGHEFLDAARQPTLWKQAIDTIGEKCGQVSFAVLTELLIHLARRQLGIP